MASAPIVLSRELLPGSQQLPQLPSGENLYRAEVGAAQQLEAEESRSAAMIGQVQRQSSAAELQFLSSVASGVNGLAQSLVAARQETDRTVAKTSYFRESEANRQKFLDDPDYAKAPDNFANAQRDLKQRLFGNLGPNDRAQIEQDIVRTDISLNREIKSHATQKVNDASLAARDQAMPPLLDRASRSGSPEERTALLDQLDKGEDDAVSKGQQTAQQAVSRKLAFRQTVDQGDIMRGISRNPQQALAALDNPEMFPSITDPTTRERYKAQARAAADQIGAAGAETQRAQDPLGATVQYSRRFKPDQVASIFDRAIVAGESSGNPNAVGPEVRGGGKALGLGQLMPATAREMARKLGIDDVADLGEAEFRSRLLSDPALNRRLGIAYLQQNLNQFDGHLAPAIAAYHAGTGSTVVMSAHRRALETFGDNYSAEQFAQLLPASLNDGNAAVGRKGTTTADYVRGMFRRLGADPDRGGVSAGAAYRISNAIQTGNDQERAEQLRNVQSMMSVSSDERDNASSLMKNGFPVDPGKWQALKAPVVAAAAMGDANATKQLRVLNDIEETGPVAAQVKRMRPEEVSAELASIGQRRSSGLWSASDQRRFDVLTAAQKEVATARNDNPVGLVESYAGLPVTRVDTPQDPGSAQFASQLSARAVTAEAAAQRYGGALKVLKPEEATALKARFGDAQPDDKARMLSTASAAIGSGRVYDAFVNEVTGSDSLARTAGRLGRTDPALAGDILRGQTLLEQPGVKPKVAEVRTELQSKLPSNVYPAEVQGDLIEAALALYASEKGKAGTLFDRTDRAGLERAIARVAGDMVDVNGRKAPVPYGTPQRDLYDGWRRLDAGTVQEMGGAFGAGGQPLDPAFLARSAVLKPLAVGGGRYAVFVPQGTQDRPVLTLDGAPAIVSLDMLRRGTSRRTAAADASLIRPSDRPFRPAAAGAEPVQ